MFDEKDAEAMTRAFPHGGDIYKKHIDLDFSISVNPLGAPEAAKKAYVASADMLDRYPDRSETRLREKVAMLERHERIGRSAISHSWGGRTETDIHPEELIFGNGAAELIYALCQAIRPKKVCVTSPGFGEYERAARSVGAELHILELQEEQDFEMPGNRHEQIRGRVAVEKKVPARCHMGSAAGEGKVCQENREKAAGKTGSISSMADAGKLFVTDEQEKAVTGSSLLAISEWLGTEPGTIVFLSNPLHPTGTLIHRDFLKGLLTHCERHGIYLCVDECFLDLCPDFEGRTLKPYLAAFQYLVILRALTKTFALPGLRIGYLISGSVKLRRMVESVLQPWNVSVPAQEAGAAAISDPFYLERSRALIRQEKVFLMEELLENGLVDKIYQSSANYLFFRGETGLYERLLTEKVLIRTFRDDRGLDDHYGRIAVRSHAENEELIRRWKRTGNYINSFITKGEGK